MSRVFVAITTFMLAVMALVAPANADPLRIGVSADYPPFMSRDGAGGWVGIDADLLNEICTRGGFDCIYEQMDLNALLPALAREEIDLAASGIGTSFERDQLIDFTCPYALYDSYISYVWSLDPDTKIETTRIAVTKGSLHEKVLIRMGLKAVAFANDLDAIAAVQKGSVGAYFSGLDPSDGFRDFVPVAELEVGRTGAAFAVAETTPELRASINAILAELSAEGIIGRAQERWLGFNQGDVYALCEESMVIS